MVRAWSEEVDEADHEEGLLVEAARQGGVRDVPGAGEEERGDSTTIAPAGSATPSLTADRRAARAMAIVRPSR